MWGMYGFGEGKNEAEKQENVGDEWSWADDFTWKWSCVTVPKEQGWQSRRHKLNIYCFISQLVSNKVQCTLSGLVLLSINQQCALLHEKSGSSSSCVLCFD